MYKWENIASSCRSRPDNEPAVFQLRTGSLRIVVREDRFNAERWLLCVYGIMSISDAPLTATNALDAQREGIEKTKALATHIVEGLDSLKEDSHGSSQ